jgi:predicted RNA-binding Zn-ribbon protein involved in translation (DUF1610 family)
MAAAQAEAAREQVQVKAREVNWLQDTDVSQVKAVACAACGANVGSAKFCPECGKAVKTKLTCRRLRRIARGQPKVLPGVRRAVLIHQAPQKRSLRGSLRLRAGVSRAVTASSR